MPRACSPDRAGGACAGPFWILLNDPGHLLQPSFGALALRELPSLTAYDVESG